MQMSISGGFLRRCDETEIITTAAARAWREITVWTLTQHSGDAQGGEGFSARVTSGKFGALGVCTALKSNRLKGCKSKCANVVLITYVKEQVLELQMEPFAYVAPGEQTLTCYLPLCLGRTTTLCVSLPGREEKQNKAKNGNEMCVGGSIMSSKHAHQQSHCIPSLWKK